MSPTFELILDHPEQRYHCDQFDFRMSFRMYDCRPEDRVPLHSLDRVLNSFSRLC